MSDIRRILVPLDASPRCAVRLQVARQLAASHDAAVVELPAVLPSAAVPPVQSVTQAAYCADLVVLGQRETESPNAHEVPAGFVESIVFDSGKPVLVVPYAGDVAPVGRNVLVAWNPTREAAHALSAAVPLLRLAEQVHVVSWHVPHGVAQANADRALLEHYLAAHDIGAKLHWHVHGKVQLGEQLLSLAADLGSDLLVMGCYGRSRTLEWVLGGTTRTVLRSMTVPVLMVH